METRLINAQTTGRGRLSWQLVSVLSLATVGCALHTQHDFEFLGPWAKRRQQVCGDGEPMRPWLQNGQCRCGHCEPPRVGPPDAVLQDGDQFDESYIPPGVSAQQPPPSVHTRFHPVPTRPVFSRPAPPRSQGQSTGPAAGPVRPLIESLPHEYGSTPRLRSTPRPQLDPEEAQEAKQREKDVEREEAAPLQRSYQP